MSWKDGNGRIMIDSFRETKHVDNSISRAADRKNQYYSLLYSEMAERKRVEENLRRSNLLLQALSQAQLQYVAGMDLASVFSSLLRTLLAVTEARLGYLREQAEADASSDDALLCLLEGKLAHDEELDHFAAMAAEVFRTGRILLLHPANEPHPEFLRLRAQYSYYLGLPIAIAKTLIQEVASDEPHTNENIVAAMVIAGNADDFDPNILELIQPLVATCAQLIVAHRNDMRRRAAELALAEERVLLTQRVAERTAELSFSNAELARAARAKDEFLATMNHELRTPLNAVLLYSESLQTQLPGPLNERQLRAVGGIRESANHLLLLINDILDVAKMDAGKLNLDITLAAVENICQSSIRLVSEMAQKKKLQLQYDPSPNITQLDVDERRLKQMLVNLLSNAIKFTPEGGKIGLEIRGDAENNSAHFTVWDTGIGISQSDIKKLFQPFVQLDGSHARQHGGTGLGLFLVYRMAELHGGSVPVTSELNQGSRFTIALPWHQQRQSYNIDAMMHPAGQNGTSQAHGTSNGSQANGHDERQTLHKNGDEAHSTANTVLQKRAMLTDYTPSVLIADDNEANIRVLTDFLQEWHCRLLIARTGVEAVQQTKEEHPDLILMDIQMPEMNGLDAIRLIRKELQLRQIPIVALTALAMPGDREQCQDAGANDYLSKPIQIERLTEVLNLHLKCSPLEEPL
jgi:signal transduction histidine kinase/CheY-like chemotaxis protein